MGIINKKETLIPGKSTELVPKNDTEVIMGIVKETDLPKIISGEIQKLNELEKSVTEAIRKAEQANISAGNAYGKSAGLFKKKAAIESLQDAVYDQAQAVMSAAEAQKISFEFQTKLVEISKFLFNLGISNIALNRSTVRQLQLKMEGASKAELSELARKEILMVVKQLKAQEDILVKQQKLEEGTKQHEKEINLLKEKGKKFTKKQNEHAKKVEIHEELLEDNEKKIKKVIKKANSNSKTLQSLSDTIDDLTNKLSKHKLAIIILGILMCGTIFSSIISLVFLFKK